MPEKSAVHVLNPTSIEQSILRTSMLPGILQVIKYNDDHQNSHIAMFEIGRTHFKEENQYKEQSVVGIALAGKEAPHHWKCKPQAWDFYALKGIVENLMCGVGVEAEFKSHSTGCFHPGRQASINVGGRKVGIMGEIHPHIGDRLGVSQRIYFAEINLHELYPLQSVETQAAEIPIFPASSRDATVTIKKKLPIESFFRAFSDVSSPYLEKAFLLDIYENDKLGNDSRNVTFRFVYRDKEKTIEQSVVDQEHARILAAMATLVELESV